MSTLEELFRKAKEAGGRFILRFYYEGGGDPESIESLRQDIAYFVPQLQNNRHQILTIQAGFLGSNWGEWWGSCMAPDQDHGTNESVDEAKRTVVKGLTAIGVDVSVRYPRDVALYFHGDREVGWHDDAVLAQGPGGRDAGTFDKGCKLWKDNDISAAQAYTRKFIHGIRGGECCEDAGTVPELSDLIKFVEEYRLCYLNVEYPSVFLAMYRDPIHKKKMDEIGRR
ncbi:hypothetical protein HDU76_012804 [Blyttiomyces sp. JEL0837]|nr:hypothetical protein HDU76_012804 [Blyttiomyces sp. JEL0837]